MRATRTAMVVAAASCLVLVGCQWPMYGYGPAHTGHNTAETKIGVDNVASLTEQWRFDAPVVGSSSWMLSAPAVAEGVVYVGSGNGDVYAFDARGTGCAADPATCEPLWTASTGNHVFSSPAVVDGVVYVGSDDGNLYAFDAAGVERCGGSPTVCEPLWTADVGAMESSPTVADGKVYVSTYRELSVLDAAGIANCAGEPKVCTPFWTAPTGSFSSPAVVDGVVYVGTGWGDLRAFDADGVTNCGGTPTTCEPLWRAAVGTEPVWSSPSVADGIVYITDHDGQLHAFDAAGGGCGGDPVGCEPLWTGPPGQDAGFPAVATPAVADGKVFSLSTTGLAAFDAAGTQNCSGTPKRCDPLWSGPPGFSGGVTVANGLVFASDADASLAAFDQSGQQGCSGAPTSCEPLWEASLPGGPGSVPTVVNGRVHAGSFGNSLVTFGL